VKRAALKRKPLVAQIAKDMRVAQVEANRFLSVCLKRIQSAIMRGDEVNIRNFGTFTTVFRKGRGGRNPATGEPVAMPDVEVVRFRPAKRLKLDVRQAAKRWRNEPTARPNRRAPTTRSDANADT
jgi:nucleoid DNA-binding protein